MSRLVRLFRGVPLIVLLALPASCNRHSAPTPQYAAAVAAYEKAMASSSDLEYTDASFVEVVRLLRAVPDSNGAERRKAALLADEIEKTRSSALAKKRVLSEMDKAKRIEAQATKDPPPDIVKRTIIGAPPPKGSGPEDAEEEGTAGKPRSPPKRAKSP